MGHTLTVNGTSIGQGSPLVLIAGPCVIESYEITFEIAAFLKSLTRISDQTGVSAERMAYVGDDLPDLPIMTRVGVSIAVSDACDIVRRNAAMVTMSKGGRGAVREICETILKAQGLWQQALKRFI